MPKPKRSFKIKRFKRYVLKLQPDIEAKRFQAQMSRLEELLRIWLIIQDNEEKDTLPILQGLGIPQEKLAYYLAYAKELINRALLFEIDTMLEEFEIKTDIFVKRGLAELALREISQTQEKWASVWASLLGFLKNAYMDYCFMDYCRVW
jgi:hypothetical protein